MCSDILFEDHDVLMLYDNALDGIDDAGNEVVQHLGIVNLNPSDWFSLTPLTSLVTSSGDSAFRERGVSSQLTGRTRWSRAAASVHAPVTVKALCEFEQFYNGHRPRRALGQAAPLRALPEPLADSDVPGHQAGWFRTAVRSRRQRSHPA